MRRTLIALLSLVCCLAVAGPASAASPGTIYDDCQDNGRIDGTYSQSDYQRALRDLPSDLDEYTDCRNIIRSGQLSAAGGGGSTSGGGHAGGGSAGGGSSSGGGSGGGTPPSAAGSATTSGASASAPSGTATAPAATASADPLASASPRERAALTTATKQGAGPVTLDGSTIKPGTASLQRLGGDGHRLPAPVLALLALAAAAVALGGGSVTWSRVRARGAR